MQNNLRYIAFVLATSALAACGGVTEMTKTHVANSETAVLQAQQTIGNGENGALELQRAKDNLTVAKNAVTTGDEKTASHSADQARLDAELAVAKSQSATARKAVDELTASIQTIRDETQRAMSQQR
jgi:hypothetical protein